MPKKNAKAQKSNELDGAEFFAAINLIEKEKGIPKAYMLEKITQALVLSLIHILGLLFRRLGRGAKV